MFLEQHDIFAGGAWLNSWKSAIILLEECGYIAGRAQYMKYAMKIVAFLSCSAGRTYFPWTKNANAVIIPLR
jgi:hypothetical protein